VRHDLKRKNRGFRTIRHIIVDSEITQSVNTFPELNILGSYDKFYFGVYVSWGNATFRGAAWFDDTVFVGRAWFGDSTFHQEAHFHDVAGTRKAVPLSFKRASFTRHPPDFYGLTMHRDTDWTAARWPNTPSQRDDLDEHIRAYQRLHLIARGLGKVDDKHMFFRKEMDCKRAIAPWFNEILYWIYKQVSDYGHSVWQPLSCISGLWLIWTIGYTAVFLHKNGAVRLIDTPEVLIAAAGLSFTNIFSFFGFDRRLSNFEFCDESYWFIFFTGAETILGFILLFFLGLGLRNSFRLK
jgi:hypothetical protein